MTYNVKGALDCVPNRKKLKIRQHEELGVADYLLIFTPSETTNGWDRGKPYAIASVHAKGIDGRWTCSIAKHIRIGSLTQMAEGGKFNELKRFIFSEFKSENETLAVHDEATPSIDMLVCETSVNEMFERSALKHPGEEGEAIFDEEAESKFAAAVAEDAEKNAEKSPQLPDDTKMALKEIVDRILRETKGGMKEHHDAVTEIHQRLDDLVCDSRDILKKMLEEAQGKSENAKKDVEAHIAEAEKNLKEKIRMDLQKLAPVVTEIKIDKMPEIKIDGKRHKALEKALRAVFATKGIGGVMLVGPAGSGKTTLATQIAEVLKLEYHFQGAVDSDYRLFGFRDAQGEYAPTPFRKAYEFGGVFLFDEIDASDSSALIAINAALANGAADFPDAKIDRHDDFIAVAAANTYGRGANRIYIGRNRLDGATLDRFVTLEVDYDSDLEFALAGNPEWVDRVQKIRDAVGSEKLVVSPRASIYGARLLAAGMDPHEVEEAVIWKGAPDDVRDRVSKRLTGVSA